jgi:hypothetical protein
MSRTFGRHTLADNQSEKGPWPIERYRITYPNGYGASVVRGRGTYGSDAGLWELGVLDGDELTYITPVTSDVLGSLTEHDVAVALDRIAALDRRGTPM